MRTPSVKVLRKGFTTGTYLCAGVVAGLQILEQKTFKHWVKVCFPDQKKRLIQAAGHAFKNNVATTFFIKNAGDDPDISNRMKMEFRCSFIEADKITQGDLALFITEEKTLVLRPVQGVGIVKLEGLGIPVAKPAISQGPQKMLKANLTNDLWKSKNKTLLVEILFHRGKELAQKTLNEKLGVIGGLSILGTSGIVEPYSNRSYIHTIQLQMKQLKKQGHLTVALVTGNQTESSLRLLYPDLPKDAVIRIGDFIAESCEAAAAQGIKKIYLGCMPGKLYKYACGFRYTHAHKEKLTPALFLEALELTLTQAQKDSISRCHSIAQMLPLVSPEQTKELFQLLRKRTLKNIQKWSKGIPPQLHVFDRQGQEIQIGKA